MEAAQLGTEGSEAPTVRRAKLAKSHRVPEKAMEMAFTAVFRKVDRGYVAYVEELPGANTQGATLEEARQNLREAVELVIEANRALTRESASPGDEILREPLKIAIG